MSSKARAAFEALDDQTKIRLARDVFETLEYDEDGNPGKEWSSDTTQALSDLFYDYGVMFTDPNAGEEPDACRGCGRDELTCSLDPCPDVIADRES